MFFETHSEFVCYNNMEDKLSYSSSSTRSSNNNHHNSSSGYNWDYGMGMPISMDDHHQILHIDPYHHHQNPFPFNNSSSSIWPAGYPLPSGPSLSSSSSVPSPYKTTHPITRGSNTTCSTNFLFSTTTSPPEQQQQLLQEAAGQSQPQEILLGTGRDHDGVKLQRNKELEGDKNQREQLADKEDNDLQDEDQDDQDDEELGAMKEMMYKIAAMQPVDIDPASVRKPKRRNVRISDDPQSVAARLRRERISEKIRILQRLVPGGTKLDTASMLEEAVRYVKFLKRQIRLLQPPTAGHEHRHQPPPQQPADQIQPAAQPPPPPPPHQHGGFVGPFISDPSQLMSLDGRRLVGMQGVANSGIRGNPTSTAAATTTTSTTSANVDQGRLSFDHYNNELTK